MQLEKHIEACTECGLAYYKPFYEPMWLAKIMWIRAHKKNHTEEKIKSTLDTEYEWGVMDERERIIKLLETYVGLTGMFGLERDYLIALIKGENK